ncbi:MAG: hypothetical protein M1830_005948 [Pleopsidium flavum]|nr:MAG: hypothetical protein M1830_005948 [Pleopsidium flavum]
MTFTLSQARSRLSVLTSTTLSQDITIAIEASRRSKYDSTIHFQQQPPAPPPSPVGSPPLISSGAACDEGKKRLHQDS